MALFLPLVDLFEALVGQIPVHSEVATMIPVHSELVTMIPVHSELATMISGRLILTPLLTNPCVPPDTKLFHVILET